MSQSKLDKLEAILRKISQSNFKITDAMRHIGIKDETTLIRRIFLDITSGSVIKDFLRRLNPIRPIMVDKKHLAYRLNCLIKSYPINSDYLEKMFQMRIVFELSRYADEGEIRMPDVSEGVQYVEHLTQTKLIHAAKLDWRSMFTNTEMPFDMKLFNSGYERWAFFYGQVYNLPWEMLIWSPSQDGYKVTPNYPMQPIHWDNGVIKFEKNPIIDWLVGATDLNKISRWCQINNIDTKYIEQFYQLMGYSISLYNDLPDVHPASCIRANEIRDSLLANQAKQGDSQTQPAVPFEQHLSSTQDNFNGKILDRLDTIIDLIKPKESVMDEKVEVCSADVVEPTEDNTVSMEVGDKLHLLIVRGMLCLGPQAISAICKSAAKVVILNCSFHKDQVKHIAQSGKVVIFHDGSTIIGYTDSDYFTPRDPVSKPLLGTSFEIHQN